MRTATVAWLLTLAPATPADKPLEPALARLAEEAEVFARAAPQLLARETLRQRARMAPPRFRPRLGAGAAAPPPARFQTREVVSEYAFSTFKDSPHALHEFRQVISVDGRPVRDQQRARTTLVAGITGEDDRLKKRMLDEFERYGLVGAATDFGQLLLLFSKRRLSDYTFQYATAEQVGPERASRFDFRQIEGPGALTIFERRRAIRRPLEGAVWLREPDALPLRVLLVSRRQDGKTLVRDSATVDYTMSSHGVVVPAAVVHRQFRGDELFVENVFQYSSFRKFSAQTELKFTPQEAGAPPKRD